MMDNDVVDLDARRKDHYAAACSCTECGYRWTETRHVADSVLGLRCPECTMHAGEVVASLEGMPRRGDR